MKHLLRLMIFSLIAFFLAGCSEGHSPLVPSDDGFTGQISPASPASNPFAGVQVDEQYYTYTITGESFIIDNAGGFQRDVSTHGASGDIVNANLVSADLDKVSSIASVEFNLHNEGSAIFDAHLVLDEILPSGSEPIDIDGTTLDGKPFWNFGIIPSGKTSPTRNMQIQFSGNAGMSVKAHIEFKERAYVQWDDVILHTDGFNGDDIINSPTYGEIVSNEVKAGIPEGSSISDVYDYLKDHNLMPVGYNSIVKCMELRILDGRRPEKIVTDLENDSFLFMPEINPIVKACFFPNDPPYDPALDDRYRWAFERVQAVEAWDWYSDEVIDETGDASVWPAVMAIIDSGLMMHEDFGLNGHDIQIAMSYGKNFVNTIQHPVDDFGHGTNVAGVAGAMGNNGKGLSGMAWNPIFLPIKVLDSNGYASGYSIEYGIAYVGNLAAQIPSLKFVVNLSLGLYSDVLLFWQEAAINYLNTQPNTLICASAGNDRNDRTFPNPDIPYEISADNHYPSAFEACICVGASSKMQIDGKDIEVLYEPPHSWGTNWGDTVDLCAPGSTSIFTTDKDHPGDYCTDFGGTSATTAFVSGTAALIWQQHPDWTKNQVREQLKSTTDPMFLPGEKVGKLGTGRLNAFHAIGRGWQWAKTWGGSETDYGRSTAVDNEGNIYVTGTFEDVVEFNPDGGGSRTSYGSYDVYLSKFDSDGNWLFTKTWGGSFPDHTYSVAVDNSGNVYVTGYFGSTAAFNPDGGGYQTSRGGSDAYLSKFDSAGIWKWTKTWGGTDNDGGWSVAVDSSGNAYISGGFQGTAEFNPNGGGYETSKGRWDVYLTKFDSIGNWKWAKTWGGPDIDESWTVTVDNSGNAYVAGFFEETVEFNPDGGEEQTSKGWYDAFLSKFDTDGNWAWSKTWGGESNDKCNSVVVQNDINVYVSGCFAGIVEFDPDGGGEETSVDWSWDVFLSKFNFNGDWVWVMTWGGTKEDIGWSVALDPDGKVFVTGTFEGTVEFDPFGGDPQDSKGGQDAFLSRFDLDGNWAWAKTWGGTGDDESYSVTLDNSQNVYVTGFFEDTAEFNPDGGDEQSSNGSEDVYLSKFGDF